MNRSQKRLSKQMAEAMKAHIANKAHPNIPDAGGPLWQVFSELSRGRTYSGLGPNPISFQEIDAWCRLVRMPLQPHHIEIINAMDQAWLSAGTEGKAAPRSDLTPGAFDAVFG